MLPKGQEILTSFLTRLSKLGPAPSFSVKRYIDQDTLYHIQTIDHIVE